MKIKALGERKNGRKYNSADTRNGENPLKFLGPQVAVEYFRSLVFETRYLPFICLRMAYGRHWCLV